MIRDSCEDVYIKKFIKRNQDKYDYIVGGDNCSCQLFGECKHTYGIKDGNVEELKIKIPRKIRREIRREKRREKRRIERRNRREKGRAKRREKRRN